MGVAMRLRRLLFPLLAVLSALPSARSEHGPGEFSFRPCLPLNEEQRDRLRHLVASDQEARKLFAVLKSEAEARLGLQPRPIEVICYEGLVNTDPKRIASVASLSEMEDVSILFHYWQATGDASTAAALKRFILAWAATYRPTGNDVNENKLYPVFVAYLALRPEFESDERKSVDQWIETLAGLHAAAVDESRHITNRYTKRLRLLAVFAKILNRPDWHAQAMAGLKRFVQESLRADGSSLDLEMRDSLTYHNSALQPAIDLAVAAGPDGPDLYAWTAPSGGSLKKSVDYVVPFANRTKTREEWRNSSADLDRRRAAAGLEEYRAGRLFDPQDALGLLEAASCFDPGLVPLVLQLQGSGAERYGSWTMLVNAACRE